ncbi:hypothetical protein [Gulosibacter sp. ACHW.36C]|uniref:Type II toxin-antitoxin system PemK/MazF family toxin n=1 Tax=Gulosibacter sediminis TaxID=1729695 RepID=A0ABY4MXK2_9MICO|nr:hypothetical protein [Gulosibacter sediminis]UQN13928.1 hypothetical protein M3M28_07565 [Gulosibacter sediminis]
MASINWGRIGRMVVDTVVKAVSSTSTQERTSSPAKSKRRTTSAGTQQASSPKPSSSRGGEQRGSDDESSPGQYGPGRTREIRANEVRGIQTSYAPDRDGTPDPGEVVWTWVPYVENDGRGKDRPVLILARIDANSVLGCYLSTKQHNGYVSVGAGDWDSSGRESFMNPARLLRVTDDGMRREGAVMPRGSFDRAIAELSAEYAELF